jgi:hypothetical protein
MAALDDIPLVIVPPRHDGLATCRLCTTVEAAADHEWCPAVGGLVCERCCRRALLGEDTRLFVIAATRAGDADADAPEDLAAACVGCSRGRRWFEEQLREHLNPGGEPC